MTGSDFTERDIHLEMDGELPPEDRAAFERWLEANPEKAALSSRYHADTAELRELLAGVLDEPVPERLARAASGGAAGIAGPPRLMWKGLAAAAILAVGGLAGFMLGRADLPGIESETAARLADRAIEAHVIYAAEKLHVVEVGADQRDHLLGWLSKRVGRPLVAPDLSSQGYELVGGRLLPAGHRAAAQFMYQDRAGNRVSLYVSDSPGKADTGFRLMEESGARALYWIDEGFGCAVTGTAPADKLRALATLTYRQILAGSPG